MQAIRPRMNRAQLIAHCAEVLRRRGRRPVIEVPCGINNALRADIVTWSTVYEFREILNEDRLYAGTGQGLTYAASLRRRRVVVVGYLPEGGQDRDRALYIAANIENIGNVRVSFVDIDPFWELISPSYDWLRCTAILAGAIALTVFAIPLLREEVGCRVYPELETCVSERVYRP